MSKIFLATFAIFFICGTALAQSHKIGILTDLTGKAGAWGLRTRQGAELAWSEIEAKEPGALQLIFEDHAMDTKRALSAAQKLLLVDKVDAIYSESSPTTIAISALMKNSKKLLIYAAGATSPLEGNSYAFKSLMDIRSGCADLARHFQNTAKVKIALLRPSTEFGELCWEGLKTVVPDLELSEYNVGDLLNTQMLSFKAKGIDVVIHPAFEPDMLNMLKALDQLHFYPAVGTNEDTIGEDARKLFPNLVSKVVAFGFGKVNQEFEARFTKFIKSDNSDPLEAAALAYIHTKQVFAALRDCGNQGAECQRKALLASPADETMHFKGWKGQIADFETGLKVWNGAVKTNIK